MKLSILIPTIVERSLLFQQIWSKIKEQVLFGQWEGYVEVLSHQDNKEISIGAKRQSLLEKAKGEYVVFVDDDDDVPTYYVEEIMKAISEQPDTVGFQIKCSGTPGITANASNRYKDWGDYFDGFDYVRTPYQKTPIKKSIALKIGYKDMRFGEDYDYSKRLKESGLISTECYIPKVMYFYRFKYENPKTKYGF